MTLSNLSFTLGSSSLTTKLDQMLESDTSWSNIELLGFDGSSLAVDDSFRQAIGQTDSLSIDGLQQSAVHNVSLAYSALKEKVIAPGSSGTSTSASWNQITNLPTDTTKVLAVSKPSASYAATKLDATAGGTSLSDVANTGVSSAADRVVAQFTTDGTVIGQSNGAQGWVDVASASFDQSQLLGPSDPSGAGKVSFGDLDLKVSAGSLEPLLFQDLTNGTGISVKLAVYGASGALTDSYDFSLASIVSAISADANGDQSYSIKFDDERSRHYAPGASQPATAGWNQITNTADVASPVTKAIALSGSPIRSAAVTNSTVDGFPEQAPADDASLSGATPDTKYYLRFTDTSGQVYSADAGSLFAVTNVQFGASNVGGPSSASGASAGKVTLSNLSFTLGSSSLTTKLDQMLESGTSWSDVELLGFDGSSLAIDDSFKQAIDKTDSVSIDGWNQFAVHNVSMAYGTLQEQVIAPGSSGTSTSASWNQITNLPADTTKVFAVSKPSASNAATKLDATTGGTSLSDVANTGVSSAANRVLAQFTTDGTVIGQSNGAQGWVDVASASFDQSQLLGLSNPSGAGKVSFGDLDLKLSAGLLEPLLFQDLTNGTGISVKLAVYGGSGTLTDSYDFSLASIASAISADANADQSYSIKFDDERSTHYAPGAGEPTAAGWNRITNTADVASPVTKAIALSGSPVRSAAATSSTDDGFPTQVPTGYATPAGARESTDYALRFTDASGQVFSADGTSLFAVTDVQFGARNVGGPSSASGASASKVALSNLSFTLGSSSLTTKLDQMLESGKSWSDVELLGFDGSSLAIDDTFTQAIGTTDSVSIDGLNQSAVHKVSLAYGALDEQVAPVGKGAHLPGPTMGGDTSANRVLVQFTANGRVIGQSNGSQGWVDVASASFDQSQSLGLSDASGASKVSFGDLGLKLSAGSLEPLLFQDLTTGTRISVKMAVYGPSDILTDSYDFSNASIASAISADANGDQTYSIQFGDEQSTHFMRGASQPTSVGWNQVTNAEDDTIAKQTDSPALRIANVQDGYLAGALVFADANDNGLLDTGESFTTTDEQGNFTLVGGSGPLVVSGGTDATTKLQFSGTLIAPADATVVTPLTTAVMAVATTNGLSVAQAVVNVTGSLGLPIGTDLTKLNAVAGAAAGDQTATATYAAQVQAANAFSLILAAGGNLTTPSAQAGVATLFSTPTNQLSHVEALTSLATAAGVGSAEAAVVGKLASSANALISEAASSGMSASDITATVAAVATVAQGSAATSLVQASGNLSQLASSVNEYTGANLLSAVASAGGTITLSAGPTVTSVSPAVVEKGQTTVIGRVAPAVAGDTLVLQQTAGIGTLNLGPLSNGAQQVIYTAPASVQTSALDQVGYSVIEANGGPAVLGSASVQLDAGATIASAVPAALEMGQATVVGTVTPGLVGDVLSLKQTAGSGTLSLGAVRADGTQQVIYTAPASVAASGLDAVAYTITDQHADVVAAGSNGVQLDAGATIASAVPAALEMGQATVVRTVTPGLAGDVLSLKQTAGSGTLSLGAVRADGTQQVIYTAPASVATSGLDAVAYTITDQHADAVAAGSNSVQLDAGATIASAVPAGLEKGQATVVGTVTPGLDGDVLSLKQTAGSGTLSLGAVRADGTQQVIYTAPASVATSGLDAVAYTITDQHADVVAAGSSSVQLDAGATIASAVPAVLEMGQATVVGTVTPGLAGDVLSLKQTAGSGTLSLGAVRSDGTQQVIYTAPASVAASGLDAVAYTITDQHADAVAAGSNSVQLDAGATIASAVPAVLEVGQATVVGTVTPGLAGDVLSLKQTAGSGTLSLGAVRADGTQQVIYTAPASVAASGLDAVAYTITDQHADAVAAGSTSVQLDAGATIASAVPAVVEVSQATVVGTVTPGLAGDMLSLKQTAGSGTLSLGAVRTDGTQQVIYTAPASVAASGLDAVAYTITDQHADVVAAGSSSVQLDAGATIASAVPAVLEMSQSTVVGTVTPGLAGDVLSLKQTAGSGTLSLGAVRADGTQQVIYTAPTSVAASGLDAVAYTITDQHADAMAAGSSSVQLDAGATIASAVPAKVGRGKTVSIGSVAPGLAGDRLTLTQTAGAGTLALVNGSVQYTAPLSSTAGQVDKVAYKVIDQHNDAVAAATASVLLDPGPTAGTGTLVVGHNQAQNLTALVSGLVRPGLTGDTETITSFVAAKGSARIQANGALSYTSASSGPDTLTYTVADQLGDTATGTVAVTVDGGPVSSDIVSTVKVGTSINLTPLILAASTPGLKGDVLTVTADATSGTAGSVSLVDGVLTYAAVGSGLSHITANGSQTDSVGYTVADQYGDTAQAVAKITITNPATIIKGPLFGLATIQGTSGTDIINASGYFNMINANGGNDVVNAGLGNATVTTSTGDVVTNLAGYLNTVSGGDGRNIVSGSWGLTSVTLGNGNDSVSMGGFANTVRLGNGNDLVKGGQGADEIVLGNGDDSVSENGFFNSIRVGSGANTIIAGSGLATVVAGGGTDAITLAGTGNNVTLNGSMATVSGGQGADRVTATGGRESLTFAGWNSTADLNGTMVASITDLGNALRVNVGSSTQTDTLTGFGSRDTFGIVDLQNGAGGYTSINAVVAALHSDGHGGTMLALGTTGSIDFANTNANQIHASNFKIG